MVSLVAKLVVLVTAIYIGYKWIDRFEPSLVAGKRVLVTGASRGIGEHLALEYAKLGARVIVTARSEDALKKVVAKCKEVGESEDHHYITTDVAKEGNAEKLIQDVEKIFGGLDILVLNHVAPYKMGWWVNKDNLTDFNYRTTVNYISYVHLATHALRLLEKSPGSSIVVINSIAGLLGMPMQSDYAGAKGALNMFFKSLRAQFEFLEQDISVTVCFVAAVRVESAVTLLSDSVLYHRNKKVRLHMPDSTYLDPREASLRILKAGALKESELYYPYFYKILQFSGLYDSELMKIIFRSAFSYEE